LYDFQSHLCYSWFFEGLKMGATNATAAQVYFKNSQMATKKFLYTDLSSVGYRKSERYVKLLTYLLDHRYMVMVLPVHLFNIFCNGISNISL
jgi:hypothetical protein